MSEIRRYTLDEARVELARRECAADGHDWRIISAFDDMACERCHVRGRIVVQAEGDA